MHLTTGVYDYSLMTSVFVTTAAAPGQLTGMPSRVSFSAQERRGHAFAQALFNAAEVRIDRHSDFQGEADQRQRLARAKDAIAEDGLWHWARGLAAPTVALGAPSQALPMLRALAHVRLRHLPFACRPYWQLNREGHEEHLQALGLGGAA